MVKAVWNGVVIAESDETVIIEGNHYFPPDSVNKEVLIKNSENTICHWKGKACYYDIEAEGQVNPGAAWYYPEPKPGSKDIVGFDYTNHVAFWRGVEVS